MPLHPQYATYLQQLAKLEGPKLVDMPIADAREMFRMAQPRREDLTVGQVSDTRIPVDGAAIGIRLYTPAGSGPFPVILMFHGGGWVIGDLDTADSQCREVCLGTNGVVVSVDYRLAPEHGFPTAAEDCYAALLWVAANARHIRGDAERIAVAGDSAGGNLAAVVAQMARDRNGPKLRFQLLVYPVTDGTQFDRPSYHDNAEGYVLTTEAMHWFWDKYALESDRSNPYASPLEANDLAGLPPALVMTAEFDPLRDEGEEYGQALAAAGVASDIRRFDGFIHGFFSHSGLLPATRPAMELACQQLSQALAVREE